MKTQLLSIASIFLISFSSTAQINEAIKFRLIDPNGNADESIIRLKDEASTAFDPAWDAWKLFSPNEANPNIYSNTDDQYALAVNAIPTMQKDTVINLFVRAKQTSGTYTLETEKLGTFPPNMKIALKDLVTGDIYNLCQNVSHTFDIVADPNNDHMQFEVFYSTHASASVNEDDITATNNGNLNWIYSLKDENGQEVATGNSFSEDFEISDQADGDYTLLITDEYQLTDTLSVTIDNVINDPPNSSTILENPLADFKVYAANGQIFIQNFESSQMIDVNIYSAGGQLMYHDTNRSAQDQSPILIEGSSSIAIIVLSNQSSSITFKVFI